jgi:CheY-like chemotaxis protein
VVVDDHEPTREMIRELLEHDDMRVRTCADVAEALEAVSLRTPDVVLTDLALPMRSGRELAELIRADPSNADISLVAISGEVDPSRETTRAFDAYLTKPIDVMSLSSLLHALHENAHTRRNARRR